MSDPFARLRGSADFGASPDVGAIKLRARGIERRRRMLISGSAVAVAVIAVAGILIGTNPSGTPTDVAQEFRTTPTPPSALMERSQPLAGVTVEDSQSGALTTGGSGAAKARKGAPVVGGSSEAGASADTAAAAPARGGRVEELQATLEIEDQTIGRGKTFTLKVCNQSSETVTREFGTSQRYDFEVSQNGELVWRWSEGMSFAQVIGEESWKPKACKTWAERWDATNSDGAPVPTGEYEAVGILKTSPELRTQGRKFSVSAI